MERRKGGANPKANPQGGEGTNRGHGGKTGLEIIMMEEAEDLSKKPSYKTNSYYTNDFGLSLAASGLPSKFPRPSRSLGCWVASARDLRVSEGVLRSLLLASEYLSPGGCYSINLKQQRIYNLHPIVRSPKTDKCDPHEAHLEEAFSADRASKTLGVKAPL
jgi:hypothetical protein